MNISYVIVKVSNGYLIRWHHGCLGFRTFVAIAKTPEEIGKVISDVESKVVQNDKQS